MKTINKLLLLLLLTSCFTACATTAAVSTEADSGHVESGSNIEKKKKKKKLLFKDWKYKGFGQALPAWFEAAYKNAVYNVKKSDVKLSDCEIVIIRGEGVNSDQADKVLKIKQEEISPDFILYDTCWASIGAGDYVALAVFYK